MKKKSVLIPLIISLTTLSSCGFSELFFETKLDAKRVNHYELFSIDSSKTYSLDELKSNVATLKFLPGQEYLPLISLEDYAKLIPLAEGYGYKVQCSLTADQLQIGEVDSHGAVKTPYFVGQIDISNHLVYEAGSASTLLRFYEENVEITKGLSYDAKGVKGEFIEEYSYSGFGISTYLNGGIQYYPLYFLDMAFSSSVGVNVFYDFDSLYVYDDDSSLLNFKYDNNGTTCGITTNMQEIVTNKLGGKMPKYLQEHTRELYMFMMENMYGLKKTRKISSMRQYYKDLGLYDNFTNDDSLVRGKALSNALNKLDDDHSGVVSNVLSSVWNEQVDSTRGETSIARKNELVSLTNSRKTIYDNSGLTLSDIRYSSDEKLANIVFNSFAVNDLNQLVANLEAIKTKGNVEKVVIDISTNGGGIVGLLFKVMCLISSNNSFEGYMWDTASDSISKYYGSYDSNDDGKCDLDDCYGDDFEIYLLTSSNSFSCGNALPCYAKQFNTAKIIGKNSGGGECVVAKHMLPNLYGMYHSSTTHLGYYSKYSEEFYGFEQGAKPEIDIEFQDFYSLEDLYQHLK